MGVKNFFSSKKLQIVNFILMVLVLTVAVPLIVSFSFELRRRPAKETSLTVPAQLQQTARLTGSQTTVSPEVLQNSFREIAAKVLPVVVEVDVVDVLKQNAPQFSSPFDFFFSPRQDENQNPQEREYKRYGLGSGVMIRKIGDKVYVLTNNHVVGQAEEIKVKLEDRRQFKAKIVGKDEKKDLALIVFETKENVPIAEMGDSSRLKVGDWVLAVGNPLGFESTVTAGIVSAVGRKSQLGSDVATFTDYIQTDAAINQGNSGGALVNLAGQVVGLNTWIASPSGGSIGIGFAIPINNAKKAIEDFISQGRIEYGWLGINIGDAAPETA
ncbi:MAG: trypsin-like peptidase domain-containing protein, partial [Spirochaetota bacterium]